MSRIRITVTQEDIDTGTWRDPTRCPVAQAVRRRIPYASVSYLKLFVPTARSMTDTKYRGEYYAVDMPAKAARFTTLFDLGHPVEPFTFLLEQPR